MGNNKLIFKNTLYMAMRMIVTMAVTFYTSRVVIEQLGITDFGIYTLVGGITIIMSFFTSALTAAIQRFMNVELASGSGKEGMQNVFAACWGCVLIMAAAFLVIAECGGVWFLANKINIAPENMPLAQRVLQMSLAIVLVEMMRVPYQSLIISHERMSFFAYNSIVEVALKLITALLLSLAPADKLTVYMGLLIGVAVVINLSFVIYCRRQFPHVHFALKAEKGKIKEISKFAGWNVLTSASDVAYQQGTSVILNIFYGVALNATMGVANQVKSAVCTFNRSVHYAASPQLIQLFAAGKQQEFLALFERISRISLFLVAFLGVPIMLNAGFVLDVWLAVIPPHATVFVQLIILFCIIDSLTGPLWTSMQACGRIMGYQITVSAIWLTSLPATYLLFRAGLPGYWMLVAMVGIDVVLICVRVLFSRRYCGIPLRFYITKILFNVVAVCALGVAPPLAIRLFSGLGPAAMFFATGFTWVASMGAAVYFIGLDRTERNKVRGRISKMFER